MPKTAAALALVLAFLFVPTFARSQDATQKAILERLERLERNQQRLEQEVETKDQRIQELESELDRTKTNETPAEAVAPPSAPSAASTELFGKFVRGRGFQVVSSPYGTFWFSAYAYTRYLNQEGLRDHYTDRFGRKKDIDIRNDVEFQKVILYFKGWVYDPNLQYLLYTWTSNTLQGQGGQTLIAGSISYRFNDAFTLGTGTGALPTVRSLRGSWPFQLKEDSRTMADEYFRGSYTFGVWGEGKLAEGLKYKLMWGNNLSQLNVDAGELDDKFATASGAIWWMPTTGEYGRREAYGDFDEHDRLATTLGAAFTFSREDQQSQPGQNAPDNSQIRLSDGTRIFSSDAFATGTNVEQANYYMTALDAGMKIHGYSLEGSYYLRWLDNLDTSGPPPPDDTFFDHGFELQASTMLLPKQVQLYATGSKIFGEYGKPWDTSLGLNWYPWKIAEVRIASELIYTSASAVGSSSTPYAVGGHGVVFHTNLDLYF